MSVVAKAFFLAVVSSSMLFAQGPHGGPGGPGPGGHGGGFGAMGGFGFGRGKVVTGAPYSADINSQSSQTLTDGNTISRSVSGHVARDSQGRMYSQETLPNGIMGSNSPVTVTFISDPVAGYSYVLNSDKKTAMRRALRQPPAGADPGRHGGNGGAPPARPDVVTTDLGTQTINGIPATGKSVTHTIPAGVMGNSQPIVSTSESWFSSDLQTLVLAKRNDPRSGQSTMSLTNIQRSEPAASLFQVPSDYTVSDMKGPGPGIGAPPAPPEQ